MSGSTTEIAATYAYVIGNTNSRSLKVRHHFEDATDALSDVISNENTCSQAVRPQFEEFITTSSNVVRCYY